MARRGYLNYVNRIEERNEYKGTYQVLLSKRYWTFSDVIERMHYSFKMYIEELTLVRMIATFKKKTVIFNRCTRKLCTSTSSTRFSTSKTSRLTLSRRNGWSSSPSSMECQSMNVFLLHSALSLIMTGTGLQSLKPRCSETETRSQAIIWLMMCSDKYW